MKILTVIGARPQFVKAATVSRALRAVAGTTEVVAHTGQHHDANMSRVFFDELEIPEPERNLGIAGGLHGAMTGRMLEALEQVMVEERPDLVLVYGDTNSTLAGALAAAKLHVPVAHVEAGLRSWNRRMPEEINRVVTDHVSSSLFAPTAAAVANLHREGVAPDRVHLVGDVMYDAARYFGDRAERAGVVERLALEHGRYALATIHRAENTDEPGRMRAILDGLIDVSGTLPVLWPMHPRTRRVLGGLGLLDAAVRSLRVLPPIGYLDMAALERHAAIVITDSGGVQKEAYFHRVPCVTLRTETEWVELVDAGWNVLCDPSDAAAIASTVRDRIGTEGADIEPYGTGDAAERIVRHLLAAPSA